MNLTKRRLRRSGQGRPELPCFVLNAAGNPTEETRTILMTGVARSGTSFVASVAGRLGVPFQRHDGDRVSGHWEHVALREAFVDRRAAVFERIVGEFDAAHATWAWKLPAMKSDLAWVAARVRNPCFVFTFKEPLSMAMRKESTGHPLELDQQFRKIFAQYTALLEFASSSRRPVMLVSYDKATRQIDECVEAVARFSGVREYDLSTVEQGVDEDARHY